jgi:tyrosine-protein phosphatase YwqE
VLAQPRIANEFAQRGWALQVNATSLLGRHGPEPEELGWALLERGVANVIASDGHRATRPAYLDEAYALAERRLGVDRALPLFDGTVLGVATPSRLASRAVSRGA